MAIIQLYKSGICKQKKIAEIFGLHINSIQKHISDFSRAGFSGLLSGQSGPKDKWKVTPDLKAKILLIVLKMGIFRYESIQEKLEEWNEDVSIGSIHQVLLENGLVNKRKNMSIEDIGQIKLFKDKEAEQFYLNLNFHKKLKEQNSEEKNTQEKQQDIQEIEDAEYNFFLNEDTKI